MGKYTDNLFKKNKPKPVVDTSDATPIVPEKLVSVALIRDHKVYKGFKTHTELRRSLGDKYPHESHYDDLEGFYTSYRRFVRREEAKAIAVRAGQVPAAIGRMEREFLSSDIW